MMIKNYKIIFLLVVGMGCCVLFHTSSAHAIENGSTTTTTPSILVGCDPNALKNSQIQHRALTQADIETASNIIGQPTSAEIATCGDQTLSAYSAPAITSFSAPNGSTAITAPIQAAFKNTITSNMSNVPAGSAAELINKSYQSTASSFASSLSSSMSNALNSNCDMMNQAWLIQDCVPMPEIVNLAGILGDKFGKITGALANAVDIDRLKQKVCRAASSKISGLVSDTESAFDDALNITPITDTFQGITQNQNKAINSAFGN